MECLPSYKTSGNATTIDSDLCKGMHAICGYISIDDTKYIIKEFNLKDKLAPFQIKELVGILNEHICDLEGGGIPVPKNHNIFSTDSSLITIDQYIAGQDLLEKSFENNNNVKEYITRAKEIVKHVCKTKKEGITLQNETDNYISIDPMLANFVMHKDELYYVDFFVPKTRTQDGDFSFYPTLHKRDKTHLNYMHFNSIGVFHHFYQKNKLKNESLGNMIYEVLEKDSYVNNLMQENCLTLPDLEKPYNTIINFLNLRGDTNG